MGWDITERDGDGERGEEEDRAMPVLSLNFDLVQSIRCALSPHSLSPRANQRVLAGDAS